MNILHAFAHLASGRCTGASSRYALRTLVPVDIYSASHDEITVPVALTVKGIKR